MGYDVEVNIRFVQIKMDLADRRLGSLLSGASFLVQQVNQHRSKICKNYVRKKQLVVCLAGPPNTSVFAY